MRLFSRLNLVLPLLGALLLLSACATSPKPRGEIISGPEVTTIQSSVSVAVKTSDKSLGARGYLIFSYPDQLHLAILTPFGSTYMDIFVNGDKVTCIIPDKEVAYTGSAADLAEQKSIRTWGLVRWFLARPPAPAPGMASRFNLLDDGRIEQLFYGANGLVQRKRLENGDEVVYSDYRNVAGIPFPHETEYHNRNNDQMKIIFEEPEINRVVEDGVLSPRLEGMAMLPISRFPGF
jgi:hypothetical protein